MRVTRELLINTAKDTVRQATYGSHDLTCAYITGSLLLDDPLIGGATDIDLIYVHGIDAPVEREIVPIVDDYHLDIAHHHETDFNQPRALRADAWLGSFLCNSPILLFDTNHWFEFNQAVVAAHFFNPENVIRRVRPFAEQARADWIILQGENGGFRAESISRYLNILENAANAIACLVNVPLTERRLLLDFPMHATRLGMPGLASGFIDLIVPEEPIEPNWEIWLADWRTAFDALHRANAAPIRFSQGRMPYYEKAISGLKDERQEAALWIMLSTWTEMSASLTSNDANRIAFSDFCQSLMLGNDDFDKRLSTLDAYLDTIEETIDTWASNNGL